MNNKDCKVRCVNLNACHLGLSLGIVYGLLFMAIAYLGKFHSGFMPLVKSLELLISGYGPHVVGGVMGFIWGCIGGFVMGVLIAFFYNLCNKYCWCSKSSCEMKEHKK